MHPSIYISWINTFTHDMHVAHAFQMHFCVHECISSKSFPQMDKINTNEKLNGNVISARTCWGQVTLSSHCSASVLVSRAEWILSLSKQLVLRFFWLTSMIWLNFYSIRCILYSIFHNSWLRRMLNGFLQGVSLLSLFCLFFGNSGKYFTYIHTRMSNKWWVSKYQFTLKLN